MTIWKRLAFTAVFLLVIILPYEFLHYNFFNVDIARHITGRLFDTFAETPLINEDILLMNTGTLSDEQVLARVDSIRIHKPRVVGINTCDLQAPEKIRQKRSDIVWADCENSLYGGLSRVVTDKNEVIHFDARNTDSFELLLCGEKQKIIERNNDYERIYFKPSKAFDGVFWKAELNDLSGVHPDLFKDKIVMVGYMGDQISDEMVGFRNARITPMNKYYQDGTIPDMYDIQISANIIDTVINGNFINELNDMQRVLVIFGICVMNVLLISFLKTPWVVANIIIDVVIMFGMMLISTFAIVYCFSRLNLYLQLDEVPVMIMVTGVFAFFTNLGTAKKPAANPTVTG